MEFALNVVWLVVTGGIFAAFVVWSAHEPNSTASRRQQRRIALTLTCVVALLFPIISMSDDLVATTAALEEWSAARHGVLISFAILHLLSIITAAMVATVFAQPGAAVHLASAGLVSVPTLSILSPSTTTVWSFRAPPFARS